MLFATEDFDLSSEPVPEETVFVRSDQYSFVELRHTICFSGASIYIRELDDCR